MFFHQTLIEHLPARCQAWCQVRGARGSSLRLLLQVEPRARGGSVWGCRCPHASDRRAPGQGRPEGRSSSTLAPRLCPVPGAHGAWGQGCDSWSGGGRVGRAVRIQVTACSVQGEHADSRSGTGGNPRARRGGGGWGSCAEDVALGLLVAKSM